MYQNKCSTHFIIILHNQNIKLNIHLPNLIDQLIKHTYNEMKKDSSK